MISDLENEHADLAHLLRVATRARIAQMLPFADRTYRGNFVALEDSGLGERLRNASAVDFTVDFWNRPEVLATVVRMIPELRFSYLGLPAKLASTFLSSRVSTRRLYVEGTGSLKRSQLAHLDSAVLDRLIASRCEVNVEALAAFQLGWLEAGNKDLERLTACLAGLDKLEILAIPGSDRSLASLSRLRSLRFLRLLGGRLSTLESLGCDRLRELYLHSLSSLTSLLPLRRAEQLEDLWILYCPKISDWHVLAGLPKLKHLLVVGCRPKDRKVCEKLESRGVTVASFT